MFSQVQRVVALHQEVETALRLVQKGLHDLQAVSSANDFYFSALLLLATGVERLEKSIYCLRVLEQSGSFPKPRTGFFAGRKGHNIQGLLDWIMLVCYDPVYRAIPAAEQDNNTL